ncbi:MAG: energy-coupling factor transporter transmembrane component T [Candidatus Latescibacterota bacterium]
MAILQDITLGRYIPGDSGIHRLDPRTKFLAALVLMAAVLASPGFAPLLLYCAFLALAIRLSGLPARVVLANLRPFIWLFFFTFGLHALLTQGHPVWRIPGAGFVVTREGLALGAFFSLRLAVVVVTASLMTLTTQPMELTQGLERLLAPLRRFGFPAHELAMMVSISLRFIPVLIDEAERLRKAQLARGASFGGGPIRRARSLIPLLVPLFVSAFERADRLALAMESRCYRGGEGRTSYHELRFRRGDWLAGAIVLLVTLGLASLAWRTRA